MLIRIREFRKGPRGRRLTEQLVGVLLALIIVAVVTVSLMVAQSWLPIEHVTIVYLIPVIIAALRASGRRGHADGCLCLFLQLQKLRRTPEAVAR